MVGVKAATKYQIAVYLTDQEAVEDWREIYAEIDIEAYGQLGYVFADTPDVVEMGNPIPCTDPLS